MKLRVLIDNTLYTYDENMWTGKRSLSINGVPVVRVKRNIYKNAETQETIVIKGNLLTGIKLLVEGRTIVLTKNTAFEWIMIYLPFLTVVASVILGGYIWGIISGMFASYFNSSYVRTDNSKGKKVLVCIGTTLLSAVVWLILLFAFTMALAK